MSDEQLANALDKHAGKDPANAHPEVRAACLVFAKAAKRLRELSGARNQQTDPSNVINLIARLEPTGWRIVQLP